MIHVDWTQVGAEPHRLRLERESARFFIVVDDSQRFEGEPAVMLRTEDAQMAERFMRAFVARTPGASMEALHSWRVAQETTRPLNVYPLFHAQLDESA